ncbi:MAG: type VI secretion system baseplate subunit TssF [Neisseriaceae bacterium]|nr:MAG: type VI secretion system baseplate subunit TssF [Neisseriaceae bacterium]
MKNNEFLDFYNEELYYLREIGKEFARENPQVAQYLGMYSDEIQDPFVERLLEGTAFLSARVQQKLSNEQPEIAVQMLSRLAPLWYTPTPSISMIAIEPDLTYPQWNEDVSLKRGSKVIMKDSSLSGRPATFVTSRDVVVQPLVIDQAVCSVVPASYIPESVVNYFNDSLSHICVKCSTKYCLPLSELKLDPFVVTFAGDSVKANQIFHSIFSESLRIVLWSKSQSKIYSKVLNPSCMELFGILDEDACLPEAVGELPGSRIMKEYLNFPSKFLSLKLTGVQQFLSEITDSYEFEIIFILKNRDLSLIDNISSSNFKLFATPIVNLYRKRCDPVLINNLKFEHPVIVDKNDPTLYKIHHIAEVVGILPDGQDIIFSPLHMDAKYDENDARCGYSIRRRQSKIETKHYKNDDLGMDDVFITLSSGDTSIDLDKLSSLSVVAYVFDRNLNPKLLQSPSLSLEKSLPILGIELLYAPSRPVDFPDINLAWNALQILSDSPFNYTKGRVNNCARFIKNWLYFFANSKELSQISRIESISEVIFEHCYTRYYGKGPITWARGIEATLNILSRNHSDKGALLFGTVLYHALSEYCNLNQSLLMNLNIDGNQVVLLKG